MDEAPPDISVLEANLANQSETTKQTHYFFTYVAWGMQISTVIFVALLFLGAGGFYAYRESGKRVRQEVAYEMDGFSSRALHYVRVDYTRQVPAWLIAFVQIVSTFLLSLPIWGVVLVSSLYLLRTYGWGHLIAYWGPAALVLPLILSFYKSIPAVGWWLQLFGRP